MKDEMIEQEDCEHGDVDEDNFVCLDCGKSMVEEYACKAEAYADRDR